MHHLDQAGERRSVLRGEDDLGMPAGDADRLVTRADVRRARQGLKWLDFAALVSGGRASHSFDLNYHHRDRRTGALAVVRRQVVHDDLVGAQGRRQRVLNVGFEGWGVDRPLRQQPRSHPVHGQRQDGFRQ